jgi:hypothetical protein
MKVPKGSKAFQQGFKDGCSSVLYTRGNVYYRTKYSYRYDAKMIDNPEYRFGHGQGYNLCFTETISGVASGPSASFDRYLDPNKLQGSWMAAVDYNSVVPGFLGSGYALSAGTGGDVNGIFGTWTNGIQGGTALGSDPLWSGGSSGQFFGQ